MATLRIVATCIHKVATVVSQKQSCFGSIGKLTSTSRLQTAKSTARCLSEGVGPQPKIHRPSALEKKILVWNGCYPSVEQVPETVSYAQLHKAKDWFRIRASLLMVAATVAACIGMVISGKRAVARGESIHKMNLEWHRRNKEEYEASGAAK